MHILHKDRKYPSYMEYGHRGISRVHKREYNKVWPLPERNTRDYPYSRFLPAGTVWNNSAKAYYKNNHRVNEVGTFQEFVNSVIYCHDNGRKREWKYDYETRWPQSEELKQAVRFEVDPPSQASGTGYHGRYYINDNLTIVSDFRNQSFHGMIFPGVQNGIEKWHGRKVEINFNRPFQCHTRLGNGSRWNVHSVIAINGDYNDITININANLEFRHSWFDGYNHVQNFISMTGRHNKLTLNFNSEYFTFTNDENVALIMAENDNQIIINRKSCKIYMHHADAYRLNYRGSWGGKGRGELAENYFTGKLE